MIRSLFRRAICALLLATTAAFAWAAPSTLAAQVPSTFSPELAPEAAALRGRVDALAADSMQGRATGTPGARAAAEYLARTARTVGLEPAGENGGFFQRVPLERRRVDAVIRVTAPRGPVDLGPDEVVPLLLNFVSTTYRAEGEGKLFYAGYLRDGSTRNALLGDREKLVGRVPVFHTGSLPGGDSDHPLPPVMEVSSLMRPTSGVPALLFVAEGMLLRQMAYRRDQAHQGQLGVPRPRRNPNHAPLFLITPTALEKVFGRPLRDDREPRPEVATFHYRLRDTVDAVDGLQVVAVVPGSNPLLRGEYVALGAHYDHLGTGRAVAGDSIYNGADDNASGVAALLEVAARFAALPVEQRPARSLLFVWHTAEENGMLGSAAFTARPTVTRDSIVAYLNLDMVGRNHPDSLFVLGSRRLSGQLGAAVEAANARQPRPFVLDYSLDAPGHPEFAYCRSDHVNFARYGIPVVFFTSSLHPEYHTPADEAGTLDYGKLARVTSLVGDLAADLANRPARPMVDQPVRQPGSACRQ